MYLQYLGNAAVFVHTAATPSPGRLENTMASRSRSCGASLGSTVEGSSAGLLRVAEPRAGLEVPRPLRPAELLDDVVGGDALTL